MTPDDLLCNELHGRVEDTVERAQRDLNMEHDTQTCRCEMCVAANEYEARKTQNVSEAESEAVRGSTGLQIAGIEAPDGGKTPSSTLWADAATIRAAIADTLDTGYLDADGRERAWLFLLNESDEETNQRGEFLDAVIARIQKLKEAA